MLPDGTHIDGINKKDSEERVPFLLIFMAHTPLPPAEATKNPFYANFCSAPASKSQNAKKNKNINDLAMYNPYKWHSGGWREVGVGNVVLELNVSSLLSPYADFPAQLPLSLDGLLNFFRKRIERDICKRVKRLISIRNMDMFGVRGYLCAVISVCSIRLFVFLCK